MILFGRKVGNSDKRGDFIITKLRKKSQITIPKELIDKLGIKEGDEIELIEKDGMIQIIPVVIYPKKYINELKEELSEIKKKIKTGDQPIFDSVDDLFDHLENQ